MNQILLHEILFAEAAPTPSEAMDGGIVAVTVPGLISGTTMIVLVVAEEVEKVFMKASTKVSGYYAAPVYTNSDARRDLRDKLVEETTVAEITHGPSATEEVKRVSTVASLPGYGPLAYQLAMLQVQPSWLMADSSLNEKSAGVWRKMYELSEQGIYDRKFLGEFQYGESLIFSSGQSGTLKLRAFGETRATKSESEFLNGVEEAGVQPQDVGWFWAYKLAGDTSGFSQMLEAGEQLMKRLMQRHMVDPREPLDKLFRSVGVHLFDKYYD